MKEGEGESMLRAVADAFFEKTEVCQIADCSAYT